MLIIMSFTRKGILKFVFVIIHHNERIFNDKRCLKTVYSYSLLKKISFKFVKDIILV